MREREREIERLRSMISCLLEFVEPLHNGAHKDCQVCRDVLSAREELGEDGYLKLIRSVPVTMKGAASKD